MDYGGPVIAGAIAYILIFIGIVGEAFMPVAGIRFIVTGVKRSRRNEPRAKKILTVGIVLTVLPLLIFGEWAGRKIGAKIRDSNGLYYRANSGTVEGMERILKKGVPADCTAFNGKHKNIPAQGTETTVLGYLAIYYNSSRNEHEQYGERYCFL